MLHQIDQYNGMLLDEIDRLGIAENTIFIFTADNGPEALPAGTSGVTIETARSEVEAFGATITTRFPAPVGATRIVASAGVVSYVEARVNPVARTSMLALFGAVVLVLLIATAQLFCMMISGGFVWSTW